MKFSVDHIKDTQQTIQFNEPLETFPVLSEMQNAGECVFTGCLTGVVSASREFDHIRVSARVETPISMDCSRCLTSYEILLKTDFSIIFRKGSESEQPEEDEVELGETDLISSVYWGDEIDLTHEIEEQVAMNIPIKPLCSSVCKGLCPVCGCDRNISTCSCSNESLNLHFSALKDFKANR